MLSCYIIDDEEHAVELLKDYIAKTPGMQLGGWSHNPVIGLQEVTAQPPDILFLDVDMPGLSGLDVFKILGNQYRVIFTTGHPQYAVDAYDLAAADFLLKPIRYERFVMAVERVKHSQPAKATATPADNPQSVFVQTGNKGKVVKVALADIVYAESLNNFIRIHLTKETITVYLSLRDLTEQLPASKFFRVHRSYTINLERVTAIEGNRIWMDGGAEVPVGAQYRTAFFERIDKRMLKK
ncbi:DNA-binding response regulator [Mucilaginibacter conchicola]|uniref:DNA-binding response regulator n=1 Tax=Mucilaginibacter conchicola TaxID=2303333 RepID=A0A372NU97_9SPHI|nr:LytTR family DNA-binding domain-containing protein [Mucilaginibacter conchicola]RFZ92830.1 DNA-binding response regulator [Mucilaginibacter conchicola]